MSSFYRELKAIVLALYGELKKALLGLYYIVAGFDWPLLMLFGTFLVALWLMQHGFTARAAEQDTGPQRDPAHVAYDSAIVDAAVKRPSYAVKLRTIPETTTTVTVVTFGRPGAFDPNKRSFELWVALPDELRDACKGAADPARRLQQVLGLPPVSAPDHVVKELQVQRTGLFRPCVAGGDLSTPYCSLELAQPSPPAAASSAAASSAPAPNAKAPPVVPAANASAGAPAKAGAAQAGSSGSGGAPAANPTPASGGSAAFDELYFLTAQMWNTYRHDFIARRLKSGDYPYTGFPFTGMGWSYDWSDVPNHIGVSEFVIKRDAPVAVLSAKTPADFCGP